MARSKAPVSLPKRAYQWLGRTLNLETVVGAPVFTGAGINRLTSDWVTSTMSADQEIQRGFKVLKSRARDMVRNTGLGRNYIRLCVANIVGPHGAMCEPRVRDEAGELVDEVNDHLYERFNEWGNAATCSVDGRLSWVGVQQRVVESWKQDGEAFVELVRGFKNPWAFALRIWDTDQIDSEHNVVAGSNTNEIRMGVEIDAFGKPVAYHVLTVHPSEYTEAKRVRIPAERIIHVYSAVRAGQTRGIPPLTPVMLSARMLSGYREAELVAARTAAAKMGWITYNPEGGEWTPPEQGQADTQMDASPGTIGRLLPGEEFTPWDPQHPSTAFGEFTKQITRDIASGLGVSYMGLTGDVAEANYSSARVGLLAERDEWMTQQQALIEMLYGRVYQVWLEQAALTKQIEIPGPVEDYTEVMWRPRRWPWVDPQNDMAANEIAIKLGLTSRTKLAAEQGVDFFENIDDLQKEQEAADAAGVELGDPKPEPPKSGAFPPT